MDSVTTSWGDGSKLSYPGAMPISQIGGRRKTRKGRKIRRKSRKYRSRSRR